MLANRFIFSPAEAAWLAVSRPSHLAGPVHGLVIDDGRYRCYQ